MTLLSEKTRRYVGIGGGLIQKLSHLIIPPFCFRLTLIKVKRECLAMSGSHKLSRSGQRDLAPGQRELAPLIALSEERGTFFPTSYHKNFLNFSNHSVQEMVNSLIRFTQSDLP